MEERMKGWKYKPNGVDAECQCVMDHFTLKEGAIAQCHGPRWEMSNLYCQGCEQTHGDALSKKEEPA